MHPARRSREAAAERQVEIGEADADRGEALREVGGDGVAQLSLAQPQLLEQTLTDGSPPARHREQEMLRLERRRLELLRNLAWVLENETRLTLQLLDHRLCLFSCTPAAANRFACFLCTACRVTPSASATSDQLQPPRSARSTSAASSRSARRRRATTAARP